MRSLGVDSSGLSPQEYEAYSEHLSEFERTQAGNNDPHGIWNYILERCLNESVQSHVEADILTFFKSPANPPVPSSHTFLALVRLLTHSRSSKYLTRDHVFIQTTPLTLSVLPIVDPTQNQTNPFRRPLVTHTTESIRTAAFSPPASPISQASSSRSVPPLPSKRLSTPISATSKTPFKSRTFSANESRPLVLPQHPRSASSPTVPAHDTPPLPPRPRSAKADNSSSASFGRIDTPPPPPPSRRLSSQQFPSSSMSIISSSPAQSSAPSKFVGQPLLPPPVKRTNSRTKLESTSHIGPATRLRSDTTGSSSGGGTTTKVSSSPIRRTGSLKSEGAIHSRGEEGDGRTGVALGRSKTVGSKPIPPPPKRRPESLSADPFAETSPFTNAPSTRSPNPSSKEFYPSPPNTTPPTSARTTLPASLTSHSSRAAKELTTALSNSGKDLGILLSQSGKSSEEWFRGARNGIRVAGVGGGEGGIRRKEEREKLVPTTSTSDREDEEEDELEMQMTGESRDDGSRSREGKRVEVEREIQRENEVGWSKLS